MFFIKSCYFSDHKRHKIRFEPNVTKPKPQVVYDPDIIRCPRWFPENFETMKPVNNVGELKTIERRFVFKNLKHKHPVPLDIYPDFDTPTYLWAYDRYYRMPFGYRVNQRSVGTRSIDYGSTRKEYFNYYRTLEGWKKALVRFPSLMNSGYDPQTEKFDLNRVKQLDNLEADLEEAFICPTKDTPKEKCVYKFFRPSIHFWMPSKRYVQAIDYVSVTNKNKVRQPCEIGFKKPNKNQFIVSASFIYPKDKAQLPDPTKLRGYIYEKKTYKKGEFTKYYDYVYNDKGFVSGEKRFRILHDTDKMSAFFRCGGYKEEGKTYRDAPCTGYVLIKNDIYLEIYLPRYKIYAGTKAHWKDAVRAAVELIKKYDITDEIAKNK